MVVAGPMTVTILSLAVRQRRREVAVRLALGATAPGIVALVLRGMAVWLAAGLSAGDLRRCRPGGTRAWFPLRDRADPVVITTVVVTFSLAGATAGIGPAVYAQVRPRTVVAVGVTPATPPRPHWPCRVPDCSSDSCCAGRHRFSAWA